MKNASKRSQRLAWSNLQFSANVKHFKISIWWSPSTQENYCRIATLMLKTWISRVRYAQDHVHTIICSCDGELRDHEQRPPLVLGSAARLSRISAVIRARETVLYATMVYPRSESFFDFTSSSVYRSFPGIGPGTFCALRQIASLIRVYARARPRSNGARSTINSACHVELIKANL